MPESVLETTSKGFHSILWLFKKNTAAGGTGADDSRTIMVFKLVSISVIEDGVTGESDSGDFGLTFEQIF